MNTLSSATPLHRDLENLRAAHGLVGLACLVLKGGNVADTVAVGHRRQGEATPVSTTDLWHLGSNTKAMTATMVGRLVERGLLSWDDKLTNLLPSLADDIHEDLRVVTLNQLLTHRAGLPKNFPVLPGIDSPLIETDTPTKRLHVVTKLLAEKPAFPPDTKHQYSNLGYMLIGAIAEQLSGFSWEALMQQELFAPLGMATAGFGAPGSTTGFDQPWGHLVSCDSSKCPASPDHGPQSNTTISPATMIHMSLQDWGRFADAHLTGETGQSPLLKASTFKRLHRPSPNNYAYGWIVDQEADLAAGGRVLWHNGSNTKWYSLIVLFPDHNTAFLFASNDGDMKAAHVAMGTAANQLAKHYIDRE